MSLLYWPWVQGSTQLDSSLCCVSGAPLLKLTSSCGLYGHLPLFCLEIVATFPALCQAWHTKSPLVLRQATQVPSTHKGLPLPTRVPFLCALEPLLSEQLACTGSEYVQVLESGGLARLQDGVLNYWMMSHNYRRPRLSPGHFSVLPCP